MTARKLYVSQSQRIRQRAMILIEYRLPEERRPEARRLAGTEPIPVVLAMINRMKTLPDVMPDSEVNR